MAVSTWRIEEFYGIDQSRDGSLVNEGTSPDARNMDATDGNLSVAKGYVRHFPVKIPGSGQVKRLAVMKLYSELIFSAIVQDGKTAKLYAYDPGGPEWDLIYTWPETVNSNQWDFLQCNIGNYDYLLIACGQHQMVKWDGINAEAELFGSGETVLETTVSSYTADSKTVVLGAAIDELSEKRLTQVGIVIEGVAHAVESVDAAKKSVVLSEEPETAPKSGDAVKVRGGVSDAKVNYLAMHYSRLFAAGDPEHPNRLYYSQIAGDKRTIEDWSSDEVGNSVSSGGGFIEIGDSTGDPIMGIVSLSTQLLILKRYSVYRLMGDRPSYFTIERIDAQVEQTSHTSITRYSDIAYYLTQGGLRYFNNVSLLPMSDARNIRGFLDGCRVGMSKGCTAKDCLFFTCYKGEEPDTRKYDNHIIVYDLKRRSYMIRDGFNVADLLAVDGVVYMVNDERYVFRFNEGDTYEGRDINAYWETPRTDWRARFKEKCVREIALRGEGAGNILLLTTRYDTQEYLYRTLMKENPEEVLEIQPPVDWARTFQFRIENEAGSRFTLAGGLEAYMEVRERPR